VIQFALLFGHDIYLFGFVCVSSVPAPWNASPIPLGCVCGLI
jgi:hypothetical protein